MRNLAKTELFSHHINTVLEETHAETLMDFNSSLNREKSSDSSLSENIYVLSLFSEDLPTGLKLLSLAITVRRRRKRGSKQLSTRGRSGSSNLPFYTYKIKDLL